MAGSRQTGISRSALLIASGTFIALALLIPLLNTEGSPVRVGAHSLGVSFELAAAGLGIVVAGLVFWWSYRRGRFDPFELPVWFSLNAYGQIVFNIWILQRDLRFRPFVASMATETLPALAVLLMGVGLVALWVGYAFVTRVLESRPVRSEPVPGNPRWVLTMGAWFVCKLLEILAVVSGATGYLAQRGSVWSSYLAFFLHLGNLTAFVMLIQHFRHPRLIGWLWLLGMTATNIFLGLVMGTKGAVYVLLYAVMAIYYARRRLSARWLAAGFLALVVSVPAVNTFRANLYDAGFDRSQGAGFAERLPILLSSLNETLSNPLSSLAEQTQGTFEQRQGGVLEITVSMMAIHPKVQPYVGLDMLSGIAQQLIPRFLWPGKPAGHLDLYLILSSYLGIPDHSWATPGQFADAYRTAGWPFVVVWFLLLGGLMAWFYVRGPASGDLAGTAFYLLMTASFLTYENHLNNTTLEILKFAIILWFVNKYLLFEAPSGKRRTGAGTKPSDSAAPTRGLPPTGGTG